MKSSGCRRVRLQRTIIKTRKTKNSRRKAQKNQAKKILFYANLRCVANAPYEFF